MAAVMMLPMLAAPAAQQQRLTASHCSSSAPLLDLNKLPKSRISSPRAARNHSPHQRATLLRIDLEIRNRIYNHVLISKHNEPIELSTKANRTQPGLLLVCRQIRHEARAMYWFDNHFHFMICQFNHLLLKGFYSHIKRIKAQEEASHFPKLISGSAAANVTASLYKDPDRCFPAGSTVNIDNWRLWLKSVHNAPQDFPYPDLATHIVLDSNGAGVKLSRPRNLAVGAFELVKSLRDPEWQNVEVFLKLQEDLIKMAELEASNNIMRLSLFVFFLFVIPAVMVVFWLICRAIAKRVAKLV